MGQSTNDPRNYVGLGLQSARGTEATTFYFLRHLDGSMLDPDPDIQREREGGDGQRVGLSYRARVTGDPKLNANSRPEWAGRALAGILGADASVGSISAGINEHLLVPTSHARYWTVDERSGDEVDRSVDNKFAQVQITFEAGRPLRIDAELMSGGTYFGRPVASALTVVRETDKPHFYALSTAALIGASIPAPHEITKGQLTITRDIDGDIQTYSLNRADVVEQNFDVTLDLTIKYENELLWRQAHLSGGSQVGILLPTVGFYLRSPGIGSFPLELNCPVMEVVGAKVNKLDPDGKTVYYDVAAADIGHPSHAIYARVRTAATPVLS